MGVEISGGLTVNGPVSLHVEIDEPIVPDPFLSDVTLLLKGGGANGSSSIIDETGLSVSQANGSNPAVYTNQHSQFNNTSIDFSAASLTGLVVGPTVAEEFTFNQNNGDFTIEMWFRLNDPNPVSTVSNVLVTNQLSNNNLINTSNWNTFLLRHQWTPGNGHQIVFNAPIGGINESLSTNNTTINEGFNYIAVTRISFELGIYVNGTREAFDANFNHTMNKNYDLYVGRQFDSNPSPAGLTGQIEQLRITNGVGRYTGPTMTVPTREFYLI